MTWKDTVTGQGAETRVTDYGPSSLCPFLTGELCCRRIDANSHKACKWKVAGNQTGSAKMIPEILGLIGLVHIPRTGRLICADANNAVAIAIGGGIKA